MLLVCELRRSLAAGGAQSPGNTLLDPKLHVDDAGLVRFAQKYSLINRLIRRLLKFKKMSKTSTCTADDTIFDYLTATSICWVLERQESVSLSQIDR